jgi:hypothetical protein
MVFDPAFSWALSFLHVMIASGVIFEGADMTAQTEAELAVAKGAHNIAFSEVLSIAGSGAFFNSLREDLSDFRWVLVDALSFAIVECDQNRRLSLFCRHEASASPESATIAMIHLFAGEDAAGNYVP